MGAVHKHLWFYDGDKACLLTQSRVTAQRMRIHIETGEPIHFSPNMPASTISDLQARGHQTKLDEKIGGATNVLSIDASSGAITAADSLGRDCVVSL